MSDLEQNQQDSWQIVFGPAPAKNSAYRPDEPGSPSPLFVPLPHRGRILAQQNNDNGQRTVFTDEEANKFLQSGLAFLREDFGDDKQQAEGIKEFEETGLVSTNRTMIILFCDLKGSTRCLRTLGGSFRQVQVQFFQGCIDAAADANKKMEEKENSSGEKAVRRAEIYPRAVIDKFMGDCTMFYIDLGNTPLIQRRGDADNDIEERLNRLNKMKCEASKMAMQIVLKVVDVIQDIRNRRDIKGAGLKLGARFGITCGSGITLSVLGGSTSTEYYSMGDFTVTGEAVNLGSRLEHATPAEFIECIGRSRANAEAFSRLISLPETMRATALGDSLLASDKQIIDVFDICANSFEIRADNAFRECLEADDPPVRLAWKSIPFTPRGFSDDTSANLLGGNTVADLFRGVS